MLFDLSHLPDSNRRPHPYHGCALPAELKRPIHFFQIKTPQAGLEPATTRLTVARSTN